MPPEPVSRRSFVVGATIAVAGVALKPVFGETSDFASLTLKQASDLLRRKAASPVDLTEACLKRIETYNPALNAFITVTKEQALEAARAMALEQREASGEGRSTGFPSPSRTTSIRQAFGQLSRVNCSRIECPAKTLKSSVD